MAGVPFGHGRVGLQPRHARELVRAPKDAADITQRDIGGVVSVGTGGIVRQDVPQLLAETFLPEKVRPDNQAAVGGEALVGKADADGRRGVFGVNLEPHRLVRLLSRPGNLIWFHHRKPAKRCSPFQSESFRLRRPGRNLDGSVLKVLQKGRGSW